MKLIGFIKEHDDVEAAIEYKSIRGETENDTKLVSSIISYLESGHLILAWMGYCMDLENKTLIAPHSFYTDGEWVWPSYFSYYLRKIPNYNINEDFIAFLRDNGFALDKSLKIDLLKLENELAEKLNSHS